MPDRQSLIYDWNTAVTPGPFTTRPVYLNDETLRDGLQSPTVHDPSIEDKIKILHLMDDLGIQMADMRVPGHEQEALHGGDPRGRAAYRAHGYGGPCHAGRRPRARAFHHR